MHQQQVSLRLIKSILICFANFHQSGNWKLRIRNVVCRSRMQLNIAKRSIENRRKHIQRHTWEYIYMHVCVCVWKTWNILNGLNAGQLPGRVCSRCIYICIYIERIYVCLCMYFMYVFQFVLSLLFGTEWVCINQPFSGTSISTRFIALDFIFNKPFLWVFFPSFVFLHSHCHILCASLLVYEYSICREIFEYLQKSMFVLFAI